MLTFGNDFVKNTFMKNYLSILIVLSIIYIPAQTKKSVSKNTFQTAAKKSDLERVNPILPDLIPQRKDGKLGYVNQKGTLIIPHQFKFGTFFYEDCNLLNATNEKVRKFGSAEFASVTVDNKDYRINKAGKKAYTFKKEDLGMCEATYIEKNYYAYIGNGFYGLIDKRAFTNPADYRQYQIYPQFQYLFVMEGDNVDEPMIIASKNDRFGVIDKNGKTIIPFEYSDIKRNFSWKMAHMFEVTKDGKNYFYIDENNKAY